MAEITGVAFRFHVGDQVRFLPTEVSPMQTDVVVEAVTPEGVKFSHSDHWFRMTNHIILREDDVRKDLGMIVGYNLGDKSVDILVPTQVVPE
jgi:hypothetical protein